MATICWTVGARADLREVVEYIARDSLVYAAATAGRIEQAVERLGRLPRLGRIVPEYEDESLREIVVGNYRVVYRLQAGVVGIVAVVHASRDLLRRRGLDPWDIE